MSPRAAKRDRNMVTISMKAPQELDNLLVEITDLGFYDSKSAFLRNAILKELKALNLVLEVYKEALNEVSKNTLLGGESSEVLEIKTAMNILAQKLEGTEDYTKLNELLLRAVRIIKSKPEEIERLQEEINSIMEGLEK